MIASRRLIHRGFHIPDFAPLLAFGFALIFFGVSINCPFEHDQEPYVAGIVRDIVSNGHWLAPRDYYGEISRKPPLYFWLSALVVKLSGGIVDEASARAISVVAAAGVGSMTFILARSLLGDFGGLLAYVFLLGSYGFASRAARAQVDMVMVFFLFLTLALLFTIDISGVKASRVILATLSLSLGILVKGPVVLVLTVFTLFLWKVLLNRNPFKSLTRGHIIAVLVGGGTIAGIWYLVALAVWRRDLVLVHVMQENLGHFLPKRMGGTGEAWQPFYFPFVKLFAGAFPMSLAVPGLAVSLLLRWKKIDSDKKVALAFHTASVSAVIIFFSLASSKRPVYVLPAYPSVAILLAWFFLEGVTEERPSELTALLRVGAQATAILFFAAGTVGCFLLAGTPSFLAKLSLSESDIGYLTLIAILIRAHKDVSYGLITVLLVAEALFLVSVARGNQRFASLMLGLLACIGVELWLGVIRPAHAQEYSLKSFVKKVGEIVDGAKLYVLNVEDYQTSFYLGRAVPIYQVADANRSGECSDFYLLGWSGELGQAKLPKGFDLVVRAKSGILGGHSRGEMILAQALPRNSDCH